MCARGYLKRTSAPVLLALVLGVKAAGPAARAQEAATATTIEELRRTVEALERKVEARDAIIGELLERMEAIEARRAAPAPIVVPPPLWPETEASEPEQPSMPALGATVAETAPRPAPGQIEVDQAEAATALERALVQEGALLLPAGVLQVEPSVTFTRQESEVPTLVVQDGELVAATDEVRSDDLTSDLTLRLGLPFDSQIALSLPYRYRNVEDVQRVGGTGERASDREAFGFGDFALTLSKGLLRERGWRPDLVADVTWIADTGQTDGGLPLGGGFNEITASVTASKSQDPLVFVGGLSYSHAFENDGIEPGDAITFSVGTVLAASPETSLSFFFDQIFVGETELNGRKVPGSGETIGFFSIGAASILTRRVFLSAFLGIGLTEAAPDYTVGLTLPISLDLPVRF